MNIALIVFAGCGSRINSAIPKQFIKIKDIDLVVYTIRKFEENPHIDEIVLVTSKEYLPYVECYKEKYQLQKVVKVVEGGSTRQESVRNGLNATSYDEKDNILIHDGDRPLVSNAIINQTFMFLDEYNAVTPILNQDDRIPEISNSGRIINVDGINFDIQTPQGFKYGLIKTAHNNKQNEVVTDDISLVEQLVNVKYFPGEKENFKVTKDCDLEYVKKALEEQDEKVIR